MDDALKVQFGADVVIRSLYTDYTAEQCQAVVACVKPSNIQPQRPSSSRDPSGRTCGSAFGFGSTLGMGSLIGGIGSFFGGFSADRASARAFVAEASPGMAFKAV